MRTFIDRYNSKLSFAIKTSQLEYSKFVITPVHVLDGTGVLENIYKKLSNIPSSVLDVLNSLPWNCNYPVLLCLHVKLIQYSIRDTVPKLLNIQYCEI